jgi:hypothetical protein
LSTCPGALEIVSDDVALDKYVVKLFIGPLSLKFGKSCFQDKARGCKGEGKRNAKERKDGKETEISSNNKIRGKKEKRTTRGGEVRKLDGGPVDPAPPRDLLNHEKYMRRKLEGPISTTQKMYWKPLKYEIVKPSGQALDFILRGRCTSPTSFPIPLHRLALLPHSLFDFQEGPPALSPEVNALYTRATYNTGSKLVLFFARTWIPTGERFCDASRTKSTLFAISDVQVILFVFAPNVGPQVPNGGTH